MQRTIIETDGLTKRYRNGVLAASGVSMTVRRGEVYGFLGPNGAGKTTVLRMLVGLIRPTSGSAVVAGHPPGDPRGLAVTGSLVEAAAFYPFLSGRENLRTVADLAGAPRSRVDAVLAEVDLLSAAQRRFGGYSTGMKQRLGVAAALLKQPELLILDEPTNGLDPQGMAAMRRLVRDLAGQDRTVLLSSHLLGEVEHVCDRVGVIRHGRLITESNVTDLRGQRGMIVRAEPQDRAYDLLTRMFDPARVSRGDGSLSVEADPERLQEVNAMLVSAGIGVSELRPVETSLEDVFIHLTGEEQGS
jgi:ABC-2 type transport system ATP-binding protein